MTYINIRPYIITMLLKISLLNVASRIDESHNPQLKLALFLHHKSIFAGAHLKLFQGTTNNMDIEWMVQLVFHPNDILPYKMGK